MLPELSNHKLDTLCAHFGIPLQRHHDAFEDARACAELFWQLTGLTGCGPGKGSPYVWKKSLPERELAAGTVQALTDLYGIALGISIDGVLRQQEITGINDWMDRNQRLPKSSSLDEAYRILGHAVADGRLSAQERDEILEYSRPFAMNPDGSAQTRAVQQLIGVLRGITCDRRINSDEASNLLQWLDQYSELNDEAFSSVRLVVSGVLEDGVVDEGEERILFDLFESIINPQEKASSPASHDISLSGRTVVLSGNFDSGAKSDIAARICAMGGVIASSVSRKVDFLILGGQGSAAYAYGQYGSKTKKALELRERGYDIQILPEGDLTQLWS